MNEREFIDRTIASLWIISDGDFNMCTTDDDAGAKHFEWLHENLKRIRKEDKNRIDKLL